MPFEAKIIDDNLSRKQLQALCDIYDEELNKCSKLEMDYLVPGKVLFKFIKHDDVANLHLTQVPRLYCYDEVTQHNSDLLEFMTEKLKKIRDKK